MNCLLWIWIVLNFLKFVILMCVPHSNARFGLEKALTLESLFFPESEYDCMNCEFSIGVFFFQWFANLKYVQYVAIKCFRTFCCHYCCYQSNAMSTIPTELNYYYTFWVYRILNIEIALLSATLYIKGKQSIRKKWDGWNRSKWNIQSEHNCNSKH